jgi:hypothetical protein
VRAEGGPRVRAISAQQQKVEEDYFSLLAFTVSGRSVSDEGAAMRVPVLPSSWVRPLIALLAASSVKRVSRRLRRGRSVSSKVRQSAVAELKQLVPPISPTLLGGEKIDSSVYSRFLSVCEWNPQKAADKLEKDLVWRQKYKPRLLRPSDMQILCRQTSWKVLMIPRSGLGSLIGVIHPNATDAQGDTRVALGSRFMSRFSSDAKPGSSLWLARKPLHPPHNRPPMQQWRYTRQGLPITCMTCWDWRPDKANRDERIRFVAYHMEHYIRRMPSPRVQRVCLIMDMRGFKASMLPHVHDCVNVLRNHYPGRLGCACFINVPGYFHPLWRIISPWL